MSQIRLDDEVLQVLEASTVEGNLLYLPPAQLERKLYERVNKALVMLGGKWQGGRVRAHVFQQDPADAIEAAILTGTVTDLKKLYQFYETPKALAQRIVEEADIEPEMTVLEPSAGHGAIINWLPDDVRLTCVEIDPAKCDVLRSKGYDPICADFLTVDLPAFDRIIANPPFTKGQDVQHITRMYELLSPGGVLVSVASAGILFRSDSRTRALIDTAEEDEWQIERLPEGSFEASGTGVNTCLVVARKPYAAKVAA